MYQYDLFEDYPEHYGKPHPLKHCENCARAAFCSAEEEDECRPWDGLAYLWEPITREEN